VYLSTALTHKDEIGEGSTDIDTDDFAGHAVNC
jgi:hypothetical protein